MKRSLKLLFLMLLAAGWVVAAAALHVVRTPGPLPYVGKIVLIPKQAMSLDGTFVDTTKWTDEQRSANPFIAEKLAACEAPEPELSVTQ